jgi:hypothetical protein
MLTYPSSSAARSAHIQCQTPVYRFHWEKPDWIAAKMSISDQVPLRKITNYTATIGLIAAMTFRLLNTTNIWTCSRANTPETIWTPNSLHSFQHLFAILRDPNDMIPIVKNGVTEKRRLLYVAITCAKDDLHHVVPQHFFTHGQNAQGAGMFAPQGRASFRAGY